MLTNSLCRAKSIKDNIWVVGHYVYCEGKHFIKNGSSRNEGWHEINAATINMYCRINDVSNQMVFEGDILEYRHYDYFQNITFIRHYIVLCPPKRFGFVLQRISCYLTPKSKDGYTLPRDANKMKIIGNIIDHPNLPQELLNNGFIREGKQLEF